MYMLTRCTNNVKGLDNMYDILLHTPGFENQFGGRGGALKGENAHSKSYKSTSWFQD